MITLSFFWFIAALLFLLFEMGSPGLFYFLSFFFGALAGGGISYFTADWQSQAIGFLGISALSFALLKTWVKKQSHGGKITNAQALIGKQGLVIKAITPSSAGQVKVGGEVWAARSICALSPGSIVEIQRVSGSHLIVSPINHS